MPTRPWWRYTTEPIGNYKASEWFRARSVSPVPLGALESSISMRSNWSLEHVSTPPDFAGAIESPARTRSPSLRRATTLLFKAVRKNCLQTPCSGRDSLWTPGSARLCFGHEGSRGRITAFMWAAGWETARSWFNVTSIAMSFVGHVYGKERRWVSMCKRYARKHHRSWSGRNSLGLSGHSFDDKRNTGYSWMYPYIHGEQTHSTLCTRLSLQPRMAKVGEPKPCTGATSQGRLGEPPTPAHPKGKPGQRNYQKSL